MAIPIKSSIVVPFKVFKEVYLCECVIYMSVWINIYILFSIFERLLNAVDSLWLEHAVLLCRYCLHTIFNDSTETEFQQIKSIDNKNCFLTWNTYFVVTNFFPLTTLVDFEDDLTTPPLERTPPPPLLENDENDENLQFNTKKNLV